MLALFIGLAIGGPSGCGEDKPEVLVASAKDYLAKKDSNAAIVQLKSALQSKPDLGEARYLLGRTLLDNGDAASAEIELRKALEVGYSRDAVVPALARAMVGQLKAARAIEDYASIELGDPVAVAELKTALAAAYVQQGNGVAANAAVDAALKAAPAFGPALLMQARLKASELDFDAAFALLAQLLAKDPGNYEALQIQADLLFFVKSDAEGALVAHRKALALRKDWMLSHRSIIGILLVKNDLAGAEAQLAQMKKVLPNHPQTKYFEAEMAYLKGDDKSARELSQQLLKSAPDSVKLLLLAGGIELRAGSLLQAETFAAKALQIAPDIAVTRRLLSRIYVRSGQAPKALDTLAPLLEKSNVNAETLVLAAEAALQAGDSEQAEAYFTRASVLDPGDARVRTALALGQFAKGKTDLGFSQLQEISASDKGVSADLALITARLRQRDYDAALVSIASLERKLPDKPLAAQLRGQILLFRDDVTGARQSFEKAVAIEPLYFPAAAALATLDMREKKPDAARARFDKLLKVDPKNVRALMAIVELRKQSGAGKDELVSLLTNTIKLNPGVVGPHLALVEQYLRSGDAKQAMVAAQEGIAALPDNPGMLDALGRTQVAAGDVNQALITLKKLASLQPNSPLPQLRLAEAYTALKDRDAARASLRRALAITPKLLAAQRALVMLELDAGRAEQALTVAQAVQAERPDQATGYVLGGDVETFRKNWGAAGSAYRTALKHGGATEVATKLYGMLQSSGESGEAQAFAEGWIKDHPQDASFVSYLGDLALARNDLPMAETHYLAVVKQQPDNPVALNNLAWITNAQKKPGALAYAQRAISLAPNQPAMMDTLATIWADSGDIGKAIGVEKQAIALAPGLPLFQLNLAKFYLKSGDKAQAKSELEQLSQLGDKFSGHAEVGQLLSSL